MKNFSIRLYGLLLVSALLVGCGDDEAAPEGTLLDINDAVREWVTPFGPVGTEYQYLGPGGATATVRVAARTLPGDDRAECERRGEPSLCQFENVLLEFDGAGDTLMYVAIWIFAEDRVTTMPNDNVDGIVAETLRYRQNSELFSELDPDHFDVTLLPNFIVDVFGTTSVAFQVTNISQDNLNAVSPKTYTLARGAGIMRWTDLRGNSYELQ